MLLGFCASMASKNAFECQDINDLNDPKAFDLLNQHGLLSAALEVDLKQEINHLKMYKTGTEKNSQVF